MHDMTTKASKTARVPAGTRQGGQFATQVSGEPNVELAPKRVSWREVVKGEWVREDTDDENYFAQHREVHVNDSFADQMRLLVNAPEDAPVTVMEEETSYNHYGCDTWEDSSGVTVRVGQTEYSYEGLAELFTKLEFADRTSMPMDVKNKYLGRLGTVHLLDHQGGAASIYGRIGNASTYDLLIAVPADKAQELSRGNASQMHVRNSGNGESLLEVNHTKLLGFDVDDTKYVCSSCQKEFEGPCPEPMYCPTCAKEKTCVTCGQVSYLIFEWNNGACSDCVRAAKVAERQGMCDFCNATGGHQDWCTPDLRGEAS